MISDRPGMMSTASTPATIARSGTPAAMPTATAASTLYACILPSSGTMICSRPSGVATSSSDSQIELLTFSTLTSAPARASTPYVSTAAPAASARAAMAAP